MKMTQEIMGTTNQYLQLKLEQMRKKKAEEEEEEDSDD